MISCCMTLPFPHFSLANVNLWVNGFGWYIYVHISKPHDSYLCTLIQSQ